MASRAFVGEVVKVLYIMLFLIMTAGMVQILVVQGYTSCFNMGARYAIQAAAEFTTYSVLIASWVAYKESSRIAGALLAVALFFASLCSIGYITIQFFKLSPEERTKDPLYFVLVKPQYIRNNTRGPSVVAARVIISILMFYLLIIQTYTILIDIHNPPDINKCLLANVISVYVHMSAFAIWVAYKETNWGSALFWVLMIMAFRGLALCGYILRQLLSLLPDQPVSLILFNKENRDLHTSDPVLMVHPKEE